MHRVQGRQVAVHFVHGVPQQRLRGMFETRVPRRAPTLPVLPQSTLSQVQAQLGSTAIGKRRLSHTRNTRGAQYRRHKGGIESMHVQYTCDVAEFTRREVTGRKPGRYPMPTVRTIDGAAEPSKVRNVIDLSLKHLRESLPISRGLGVCLSPRRRLSGRFGRPTRNPMREAEDVRRRGRLRVGRRGQARPAGRR